MLHTRTIIGLISAIFFITSTSLQPAELTYYYHNNQVSIHVLIIIVAYELNACIAQYSQHEQAS